MVLGSPRLKHLYLRRAVDQLVNAASSRFEQLERAQQPATRHATGQSVKVLKEHFSSLKNSWTQSEVRDTFLDGTVLLKYRYGFCPTKIPCGSTCIDIFLLEPLMTDKLSA